ncbi:putative serine/threonine-protein kinase abkB [Diplonema papillatum]|nr:putative serine/threonine-protein kinase abkB [Diplonema papillatum]
MGRKLRIAAGAVGALAAGTAAAGYADEGIGRSQVFWYRVFPLYSQYRWVQFLNRDVGCISDAEAAARYEDLHRQCSPKARDLCYEMRGFYLKNAQIMSSREDFVPQEYIKWMRETEDQAPTPFKEGDAVRLVEAEYGRPIKEVFREFCETPSGAASIGQVHHAVLHDGSEVAVKVQHAEAEHLFRGDIRTLRNFCYYFLPQYEPTFSEIEKQFLTEFNYVEEAKNLQQVHDELTPLWGDKVVIPRAHLDLCTRRVLVMDYLHGIKLVDGVRQSYRTIAETMNLTLNELEEEQRRKLKSGELELKSLEEQAKELRAVALWMRVRDWARNFSVFLLNLTPAPYLYNLAVEGRLAPCPFTWSVIPVNLGEIMRTLVDVHGDQLFLTGCFNGDPHPGNVLLLKDGRLGLIDFGQVKRLTVGERRDIALLVKHLADGDKEALYAQSRRMGVKTKYESVDIAWKLTSFWFDRDTDDILTVNGKLHNISDFLDACEAADPVIHLCDYMVMPGRMIILLRGVGLAFGMRLSMAQLLKSRAEQCLATT